MRVCVYPGGDVQVTVPHRASRAAIDRFIARSTAWILRAREKSQNALMIRAERRAIGAYKTRARELALRHAVEYARHYGVAYKKIAIRAQRKRWGSCSRTGNLSFNYKIALLPRALAEYVIVHEICHLVHFNHSPVFWGLVEKTIPDYKERRAQLHRLVFRFE